MKATILKEFGPGESFETEDLLTPKPGFREVLVKVKLVLSRWANPW